MSTADLQQELEELREISTTLEELKDVVDNLIERVAFKQYELETYTGEE
jgi:hypothetical protein